MISRNLCYEGSIPEWLCGDIVRNGPGKFQIGEGKMNHMFDGMALVQKFSIRNGDVTYQSRFVQSDTYKRNTKAGKIVMPEFGTLASMDPSKNFFSR